MARSRPRTYRFSAQRVPTRRRKPGELGRLAPEPPSRRQGTWETLDPAPEFELDGQGGGRVVAMVARSLSHETVRLTRPQAPEKTLASRGRSRSGRIPKVSAEFVAHMEEVLDLYAEPYDPQILAAGWWLL